MRSLLILLALVACAHEPPPKPVVPTEPEEAAQLAALSRFFDGFVDEKGQVTSYYGSGPKTGEREHLGDSTLWSWVAIGALDCEDSEAMVDGQLQLIIEKGGRIDRHDPLRIPEDSRSYYSFDQESGFLHGLARYIVRCGADASVNLAWDSHQSYIEENAGRLHEEPGIEKLPAEFTVLRDAIAWKLGKRVVPHKDRIASLSLQIASWLSAVKASHSACYRAHLSWLYVWALKELELQMPEQGRVAMCEASKGLDMPLWEHYCGRGDMAAFIKDFAYNRYEYALQRCRWEHADGSPELLTPGVDLFVAYGLKHGI